MSELTIQQFQILDEMPSGDSESGGTFKSFKKGTVYADNIIER